MSNTDPITQLDAQQRKVLPRIEALLRLYDRSKDSDKPHDLEEAASAMAKAQELLVAYNLSADMVGQGGDDGVREEQKLVGGGREYERDLWRAVAELNFCLYFASGGNKVTAYKRTRADGSKYIERESKYQHLHRLVGRKVNVMSTVSMAKYLEEAIERLVEERIGPDNARERWMRHNIVFREGAASTLSYKLTLRREELMAAEDRKRAEAEERAQAASTAGVSTSTALTIQSHAQAEKDANNDHANGWAPGKTAANRAEYQSRMAKRAEEAARVRAEHTRWCEDHPEEARAQAEAQRKEQEAAEKREARNAARRTGSYRWTKADERAHEEQGYYRAGREAAERISIDQQMSGGAKGSLGNG